LGVKRIAKDLKELETLNVGQCTKLTDEAVEILAKEMKTLKSIDLYGCTSISSESLKTLNKSENLKVLNLGLWHPF